MIASKACSFDTKNIKKNIAMFCNVNRKGEKERNIPNLTSNDGKEGRKGKNCAERKSIAGNCAHCPNYSFISRAGHATIF